MLVQVREVPTGKNAHTGEVFEVSNSQKLGSTEVQQVQLVISCVARLVLIEGKLERGEPLTGS
jgi:creatine kinase